jgi:hypothetical protein
MSKIAALGTIALAATLFASPSNSQVPPQRPQLPSPFPKPAPGPAKPAPDQPYNATCTDVLRVQGTETSFTFMCQDRVWIGVAQRSDHIMPEYDPYSIAAKMQEEKDRCKTMAAPPQYTAAETAAWRANCENQVTKATAVRELMPDPVQVRLNEIYTVTTISQVVTQFALLKKMSPNSTATLAVTGFHSRNPAASGMPVANAVTLSF